MVTDERRQAKAAASTVLQITNPYDIKTNSVFTAHKGIAFNSDPQIPACYRRNCVAPKGE